MFDFIMKPVRAFVLYQDDMVTGRKPWEDPTLLGMVVGFLGTVALKYWGFEIKADEQTAIIAVIGVIARMFSPHVGLVKAKPPAPTVNEFGPEKAGA